MQLQGVAPLPGGAAGASDGQVELVALAQAAALLSCRGQAAHLPVLVHRLCDPLGVGVASDGLVEGVDQDHLEELVGGVLAHPVGVEHSEASAVTASTLLQTQGARRPIRISAGLPSNWTQPGGELADCSADRSTKLQTEVP